MDEMEKNIPADKCINSIRHCFYARQCFVTGELCSKQSNVLRERDALHGKGEINAFVIMNFSGMSDVVYKWKLQSFIESLKQYLWLDQDGKHIACVSRRNTDPDRVGQSMGPGDGKQQASQESPWRPVKKINVIRADSNTASNYIICSRICQQIQIADLVIVDVSVENTNVFYEFGLAAAFGKLILPICYNESFYEMKVPQKAQELLEKKRQALAMMRKDKDPKAYEKERKEVEDLRKRIEHHIDCYPWRRTLFEHYGLRYRNAGSQVKYGLFRDVTQEIYGFSDRRYRRFPYDTHVNGVGQPQVQIDGEISGDTCERVGFLIYDRLRATYHTKMRDQTVSPDHNEKYKEDWTGGKDVPAEERPCIHDPHNTLVVYTMEEILNDEQAGLCIINFHRNMTEQIRLEHCFCGDRVAILSQPNVILDDPKDTRTDKKLLYSVGDILRIGMNQATYEAHQHRIKTDDYLLDSVDPLPLPPPHMEDYGKLSPDTEEYRHWEQALAKWEAQHRKWYERCPKPVTEPAAQGEAKEKTVQERMKDACGLWMRIHKDYDEALRFVKEHARNRCIPLLPDEPIYVKQYTKGIQQKLFHTDELDRRRDQKFDHANFYTMFHMMLYTLRYANEVVVDISGNSPQALFWLGVAHGSDIPAITVRHALTSGELERQGRDAAPRDRRIFDVAGLWTAELNADDVDTFYNQLAMTQTGIEQHNRLTLPGIDGYRADFLELFHETWRNDHKKQQAEFTAFLEKKRWEEGRKLESYYRNRFWRRLLRSNELDLYIARRTGISDGDRPRIVDISWDVQATAQLSLYLSKRTVIGRYNLREIVKDSTPAAGDEAECQKHNRKLHNFIPIGADARPLRCAGVEESSTLAGYIHGQKGDCSRKIREKIEDNSSQARGFRNAELEGVCAKFPKIDCIRQTCPSNGTCARYAAAGMVPQSQVRTEVANQLFGLKNTAKVPKDCGPACGYHNEKPLHQQLAQMVLWREITEDADPRFWVSLTGVSGPSTLALTAHLVDDQQKDQLFGGSSDPAVRALCKTPLKDLQAEVRRKLLDEYDKKLADLSLTDQARISYVTRAYLSTILYQFFFPFLSESDEMRICNSLRAFLTIIPTADVESFRDLGKLREMEPGKKASGIDLIVEALRKTIHGLQGVDVLYTVTVCSGADGTEDDRWPVDIRHLDGSLSKENVICLFRE